MLAARLFPFVFLLPALLEGLVIGARLLRGEALLAGYHIRPQVQAAVAGWSGSQLWQWLIRARMPGVGLWLLLAAILAWSLALLWQNRQQTLAAGVETDAFILLMLLLPAGLTLLIEFLFVAEPLGIRVNSVFKFYYLAWEFYAIIAVYALTRLLPRSVQEARQHKGRMVGMLLWLALLIPATAYTALALPAGSGHFRGQPTLDSLAYLRRDMPDDMAGIAWLQAHAAPDDLILEAFTQDYTRSHDAIVATITGNPTLVGWWDHELHWHGPAFQPVVREREEAIRAIYGAEEGETLRALLAKWQVDYLFVGNIERSTYHLDDTNIAVYDAALPVVFTQGGVRIYRVPR